MESITDSSMQEASHVAESYTIGDELSFLSFMEHVRGTLADPDSGEILDCHQDKNLSSILRNQLLVKNRRRGQPARCLPITLQVASAEEEMEPPPSATLFIREDNMYCLGFMNRDGGRYELSNSEGSKLPPEYNAAPLDWGTSYESMLRVTGEKHVVSTLNSAKLGKAFAEKAVRVLSRFSKDEPVADLIHPRLALAGLIVMFCESAKINPVRDSFLDGWNTGARFTNQLMQYMSHWELISIALLDWKDIGYGSWDIHPKLGKITGTSRPIDALKIVNLVRNFSKDERKLLWNYILS